MSTLILRDDFNGTGSIEGHAANVNTLGAGGEWSGAGRAELSGGFLQCPAGGGRGYAVCSMLTDAPAPVGLAMRHTWRWKPAGARGDYAQTNITYPLGINFGAATFWMTNKSTGCELRLSANGTAGLSTQELVTFNADTWYEGELLVANGVQTLNFLGHTLTVGDELTPEDLVYSLYLNMATLDSGASALLDFIQAEVTEVPRFWTAHRNTQEVV